MTKEALEKYMEPRAALEKIEEAKKGFRKI